MARSASLRVKIGSSNTQYLLYGLSESKKLFEMVRGDSPNLFRLDASQLGDRSRRLHNIGRFVAASPIRNRGEKRTVGFYQKLFDGQRTCRLAQLFSLLKRDNARE